MTNKKDGLAKSDRGSSRRPKRSQKELSQSIHSYFHQNDGDSISSYQSASEEGFQSAAMALTDDDDSVGVFGMENIGSRK